MALPGSQGLTFTLLDPPTGDLNHFALSAFVAKPMAPIVPVKNVQTKKAARLQSPHRAMPVDLSVGDPLDVSGVIAKYQSLSGNQPASYGNSVALWNSLLPNLATTPLMVAPIPTDDQV